jgi:hypothetical protein
MGEELSSNLASRQWATCVSVGRHCLEVLMRRRHESSRWLFVSSSQVKGRVWRLLQIHYNKLIAACWLDWPELEINQHHIITTHRFCDLSNSVLKEYKRVIYNKCTLSSKRIIVALSYGAWPVYFPPLMRPSRQPNFYQLSYLTKPIP